MIQKIKKEKEQFKLSDPPSVQVQCDNDPDNERDPGEPGDQVVSSRDPMLSSISPDNTKMWRSLSSESMDDAESLVYYKVGVTTHHSPCRHWPRMCPQARKPKYQKKEPRKTRKRSSPQRPVLPDLCQPPPQRIPVVSRPVTKRSVRMPGVWAMIKMISGIPSPTSPSSFHYLKNSSTFLRSTTRAPRCPRSTPAPLKMNPSPPTLFGLTPSLWPPSSSASSRRLSSPRPRRRPLTPPPTLATLTRARVGARGTRQLASGRLFLVSVNTKWENQQKSKTRFPLKFTNKALPLLIWSQTNAQAQHYLSNWYWDVTYYRAMDLFVSISLSAQ